MRPGGLCWSDGGCHQAARLLSYGRPMAVPLRFLYSDSTAMRANVYIRLRSHKLRAQLAAIVATLCSAVSISAQPGPLDEKAWMRHVRHLENKARSFDLVYVRFVEGHPRKTAKIVAWQQRSVWAQVTTWRLTLGLDQAADLSLLAEKGSASRQKLRASRSQIQDLVRTSISATPLVVDRTDGFRWCRWTVTEKLGKTKWTGVASTGFETLLDHADAPAALMGMTLRGKWIWSASKYGELDLIHAQRSKKGAAFLLRHLKEGNRPYVCSYEFSPDGHLLEYSYEYALKRQKPQGEELWEALPEGRNGFSPEMIVTGEWEDGVLLSVTSDNQAQTVQVPTVKGIISAEPPSTHFIMMPRMGGLPSLGAEFDLQDPPRFDTLVDGAEYEEAGLRGQENAQPASEEAASGSTRYILLVAGAIVAAFGALVFRRGR